MCEAGQGSGLLTTFLEQNDAPCPVCGHSLRRLQSSECPDCGAALELRLGSKDFRLGTWIALLLTLAIPLEFTTLLVGAGVVRAVLDTHSHGDLGFLHSYIHGMWPLIVQWGLTVSLLIVAIRWRQRFWKRRRWVQRLWLWGAVVLMGATLVASFWWMGAR